MTYGGNLAAGSQWCRDCGGPTTTSAGLTTCGNLASGGQQLTPKNRCVLLGPKLRNYCEQCRGPHRASGSAAIAASLPFEDRMGIAIRPL